MNRLEEFNIANTCMTTEQIRAILGKIVEGGSKLNKLMLTDLDYGAIMDVEFTLISQVRDKFGEFYDLVFDFYNEDVFEEGEFEEDE